MLEAAVVLLRLLQYTGAMVLLGSSLFFVYARQRPWAGSSAAPPWARVILLGAAGLLAVTSLLQIAAHAIQLSGSFEEGLKLETLSAVISYMDQGKAAVVRAAASVAAVLALALLPAHRIRLVVVACLGAVAIVSLVWMGHAAATEGALGTVHRVSDGLHLIAAAVWIGALVAFLGLLLSGARTTEACADLHAALAGFAGIGSAVVAVLILTGAINSWILVGLDRVESLWTTPYGQLLGLKILLFLIMLGLAASNRYRLTPALERSLGSSLHSGEEMSALRRSVAIEAALGVAVLLLVAWFGTLAPPAAG
jgi:putative copper resistance protein D